MPAAETVSSTRRPLLPARRGDLIVKPVGDDGQHVVKDPRTGSYFKLGPQESFLFEQLDGRRDAAEVCRAFSRRFGESLSEDDLDQFLTLAEESHFLAPPTPASRQSIESPPAPLPEAIVAAPKRAEAYAKPEPSGETRQSILYWRRSAFDPDALFDRLEPRLHFLWTRTFVALSATAIVAAGFVSWMNRRELLNDFPLAWAARWEVLLLVWFTLVAATTLHEFAHGLTCKHFGGEVHEVGFLLMFFVPCFYCNVSDAWLFREKSKRLWVTLAGGWCDLCLWALAVFAWRLTLPDTLPHYLAWVLMGVTGARIFFNFNPLLKLDGYYLLSDAADVPNLRPRAWDRLMGHTRWLLWGAPKPRAEARGRFLLAFGLAAWAYSAMFLLLMVIGFVHWWGNAWGTAGALAAVGLGLLTSRNMVHGLTEGEVSRMVSSRKGRLLAWVAVIGAVAVAAAVVPMQDRAAGPFRLRAASRAEIRAPVAGFLRDALFDEGQSVKAGAVVVRMEVPDLDSRITQLEAQRTQAQAELAVLKAGQADASGAHAADGEAQYWRLRAAAALVEKLEEEQGFLRGQRLKQPVRSPVAGLVTTPRLREKVGQFFREGDLICEVEDPSALEAEVAVPEQEVARVRPGQHVELKARAAPFDSLAGEVTRVASAAKDPAGVGAAGAAAAQPPPPNLGDLPGRVVVYCRVSPGTSPDALAVVRPGMSGYARVDCGEQPVGKVLAIRFMRYLRTEFWW